jgi:hypothetical protein
MVQPRGCRASLPDAGGDGSIWLGSTANGLFHVAQGRVEAFGRKDGLPADGCAPVHADDTGALWIVAEGSLVRRAAGRFQCIDARDGLPGDTLLDLIPDDLGNFWIGGKRGVHCVARHELDEFFAGRLARVRSLTLGVRDGLRTPECSSLHYPTMARTPDGQIWVATRDGLASFDPRRVRDEVTPLIAVIERVVADRRTVPLPSSPAVGHCRVRPGSDGQVVLHFAARTLLDTDRIRFRHRLVGQDSDWIEDAAPLAYYANLRPGAYTFQLQAADSHGFWSEQPVSLAIRVLPYAWRTRTFQVEVAVLAVLFGGILLWRRAVAQRRIKLSTFNGLNPNGDWTLVLADVVGGGGQAHLVSWGLEIQAVPEPANLASATLVGLLALAYGSRAAWRRRQPNR